MRDVDCVALFIGPFGMCVCQRRQEERKRMEYTGDGGGVSTKRLKRGV